MEWTLGALVLLLSKVRCRHCGLPVPEPNRHGGFCCAGCAVVHEALVAGGLDRFYDLGGGKGQPVGSVPKSADLAWAIEAQAKAPRAGAVAHLSIDVQGIRCAACVWVLQELWRRLDGAISLEINPALGQARLTWDGNRPTLESWVRAISDLGYRAAPASKSPPRGDRTLLVRFGICACLALNAMMFATASYAGLSASDGTTFTLFSSLQLLLATLAVVVGGPVFFRSALAGLGHRVLHFDLPISIGLLLAWSASTFRFLRYGDPGYLDTVTVFVTLMLLGRYLQQRAVGRNRAWLLQNDGIEHLRARRLVGSALEVVPVTDIVAGDELVLAPGDLVPVRGKLLTPGSLSFDWISGESEPRTFGAGDTVPAGAFSCGRESLRLVAEADVRESGLTRLLATPPGDPDQLFGTSTFWRRLNKVYVAAVLVLALCAGLLWCFIDPSKAPGVVTALLVVTCPCAIGIATPLAFELALGRLRKGGVFVRSQSLFEKLQRIRKVVFDKTGTLTSGGLVATVLREPPASVRDAILTIASQSNHPVSRAVLGALGDAGFAWKSDLRVTELPGEGLLATGDGHEHRLGTEAFAIATSSSGVRTRSGLCCYSCDSQVLAAFSLEEDFRPGSCEELSELTANGKELWLLSGDRADKVQTAAELLGIPAKRARGELSPEQKAAAISALDQHDTMMVGDGINDGPAFAAAFCCGTPALDRPVMPSRADFCFVGAGAGSIARLFSTGQHFASVVRTNLRLSLAYNSSAVVLCALGLMTPLLCAVLMPLSSLGLIAHTSIRLSRDADRLQPN